jgi:hypothetical protein
MMIAACATSCSAERSQDASGAEAGAFRWSEAAPCPLARFEANGTIVNGELWVMGGFTSASLDVTSQVDIYNVATDSWRAGPALPGAQTHIGVVTVGSDLIVVGGFVGNLASTSGDVWRWSAASSTWNPGPSLPAPQEAFAWALLGTQLHVAGGLTPDGNSDSALHWAWDVASDAGTWTSAAPLPDPRNHGGGASTGGRFFAIAGRHEWNETSGDDPEVDAFDPASGAWSPRAPLPTARSEIGAATSTMPDGRILVVGGSVAGIKPTADVEIYDPALDEWSALPPLPEPRKGTVAVRMGPQIVVTTGSPTSTDPSATTWVGCCL